RVRVPCPFAPGSLSWTYSQPFSAAYSTNAWPPQRSLNCPATGLYRPHFLPTGKTAGGQILPIVSPPKRLEDERYRRRCARLQGGKGSKPLRYSSLDY